MITQDEIQAAHFHKIQATIHPIVAYYRDFNGDNSWIAISNYLTYNTVSVHKFQETCIKYINENPETYPAITKIYYFTDGSAAQYKNKKNFMNLCHHYEDFNLHAEWHFFATAHGKGPSDGLGGTLKREARKASLRGDKISTAEELYEWADAWSKQKEHSIKFCYITAAEIEDHHRILETRFSNIKTIDGTQRLHCYKPNYSSSNRIIAKLYSFSNEKLYFTLKK